MYFIYNNKAFTSKLKKYTKNRLFLKKNKHITLTFHLFIFLSKYIIHVISYIFNDLNSHYRKNIYT